MSLAGFREVAQFLGFLALGIQWTVLISLIAIVGGSVIGLLVALMRIAPVRPVNWLGAAYVDFFRTTPLLVQLLWIFFALPILTRASLSAVQAGSIGMSFYAGAYMAEIIRAGILSIERGQSEAAKALGMTAAQRMRRIILPQAIGRMTPEIANRFISLVKDSSIASVIGVPELMRQASSLGEFTTLRMEVLTVVACMYFALTYPLSLLTERLHARFAGTGRGGEAAEGRGA